MSEAFEHQANSPAKPDLGEHGSLLGDIFSQTWQKGGAAVKALGADAKMVSDFANSVSPSSHLPGLEVVESAAAVALGLAVPSVGIAEIGAALATHPQVLPEAANVAKELGKGAIAEVKDHGLRVAETAVIGFAAGAAITVAVGAGIIAAPVVAIGAAVLGAGTLVVGACEAYEHRDAIIHDTEVVANPQAYSSEDVAKAKQSVQNVGGMALETGVGIVAGIGGGLAANAIRAAISGAAVSASEVATSGDGIVANTTSGEGFAANTTSGEGFAANTTSGEALAADAPEAGGQELNTVRANLADGRAVSVSVQPGADGVNQVSRVQMPDGTMLTRQGETTHWAASGDQAAHTVWDGDVRLNDQGQVRFVYQYEKAPSVVSVEARLPDGSKIAIANSDGTLSLPAATVDAIGQRLPRQQPSL